MLNGIDPIIIFQFSKLSPESKESVSKIPIVSSIVNAIGLPPIPIYLSEKLTGLYIQSEDKSIDIETSTETLADGGPPKINQKGLNSTVKISMVASNDSIGLALISSLCDLVLPKVSSKEYSITYLHGAVIVFQGLLHSFSITQTSDNSLYTVTLELVKSSGEEKKEVVKVERVEDTTKLVDGVETMPPTKTLTPPLKGPPLRPASSPPVAMPRMG